MYYVFNIYYKMIRLSMNKSKINEYFDTEDLKGKEEINFIKGDTKKELTKIVSKDVKNSNPREKVY